MILPPAKSKSSPIANTSANVIVTLLTAVSVVVFISAKRFTSNPFESCKLAKTKLSAPDNSYSATYISPLPFALSTAVISAVVAASEIFTLESSKVSFPTIPLSALLIAVAVDSIPTSPWVAAVPTAVGATTSAVPAELTTISVTFVSAVALVKFTVAVDAVA